MKNKAFFMQGTNKMTSKEIPVPTIADNEVLIEVDVVGICGSDIHYYKHGNIGDYVVEGDFILGHECAGEVVEIGNAVKTLKVGDRVALEPGKTCGKCEFCKSGKYNLCPDVVFFATPPYHGVLANYVSHPEDMCFKLPENVSNMEGMLVEPLAVGLHATSLGEVKLGDTVVIYGSGCIGLMSLLAAKGRGAAKIILVDLVSKRLEIAKKLGATHILNPKECDVINELDVITLGKGADVVIETAGAEVTVKQSVEILKKGGIIVLVGMTSKDEVPFNFMKLMGKEGIVKTIFRYRNLYPIAINSIASGAIDVKQIVSHEFDFDHTKEAFDYVVDNIEEVIKGVIIVK